MIIMPKVVFIYSDYDESEPFIIGGTINHGIASLAGALRHNHIECELLHICSRYEESDLRNTIKSFNQADVFAVSFTTSRKKNHIR
jgi:hypothetical protein